MPKLRRLSGAEVVAILGRFGFEVESTRGSHAKLRRTVDGQQQTLHVPYHRELDSSTCKAIFNQACDFIPRSELRRHFYSD